MNWAETEYSWRLDQDVKTGRLRWWKFEGMKLRLAKTWLKIDFVVLRGDGKIEFHKVKGPHVLDDARVKFKMAAELFPGIGFVWAQKTDEGWSIQRYGELLAPLPPLRKKPLPLPVNRRPTPEENRLMDDSTQLGG